MKHFLVKLWSSILALIVIAVIGLSTVNDYGATVDQPTHILNLRYNYKLIVNQEPIPIDLKHYGIFFDALGEVTYQASHNFSAFLAAPFKSNELFAKAAVPDTAIFKRIRHNNKIVFVFNLITYAAAIGFVAILINLESAWLGAVTLTLLPRFWGHSFFNPKDIPFAATFTLASLLGAYLVNSFAKSCSLKIQFKLNKLNIYTVLFGILVGIATGIRIGGFFLLFFLPLVHLMVSLNQFKQAKLALNNLLKYWLHYLAIFILWAATTITIQPASWSNPLQWFVSTLQYLSNHGWERTVLFQGNQILASELPWTYLPTWFLISTPVILQTLFWVGLVFILFKYQKFTPHQQAAVGFILLQVTVLPFIAIVKQSTLYDGLRQFLFVLPGIAILAACSIAWIYQKLNQQYLRIGFVTILVTLLSSIAWDMAYLHPYEYVYFNRTVGGLENNYSQYDTDYWSLALNETTHWLNQELKFFTRFRSSSGMVSKLDLNPNIVFAPVDYTGEFYYAASLRWNFQKEYPDCPIVHTVERNKAPLAIVKKCSQ